MFLEGNRDTKKDTLEGYRGSEGRWATHTVCFIGLSYTHTKYVHKHKYSNVQILHGSPAGPSLFHPAPHPGLAFPPQGGRLTGLVQGVGVWRRERSCPPLLVGTSKGSCPSSTAPRCRGLTAALLSAGAHSDLSSALSDFLPSLHGPVFVPLFPSAPAGRKLVSHGVPRAPLLTSWVS